MQSLFSNNISSREIANGDLNAVGVAYAQGQLLLLFLWLFAREKLAFMKYILIVALVSILVIMILTGSRGALLYVVVTLVFFYRHLILYLFNFKTFLISLIIGVSLMYTIKENEFLNFKITALADRFTSALYYLEGTKEDGSLRARKEIQTVFYDNYDEMLLGYEGYRPYPHNQFIEIYMRWGLIGLPLLIISLFSFLSAIKLIKKKNRVTSSIDYLVISLFFFCFLQSMSSLTLEMNRLMFFGLGYFVIDFRSRKSIS
jgi:O-antigen ligase